jgi:ribosome-binding factor A
LKELAQGVPLHELGRRSCEDARSLPELHFHYDDSVDRGERIDNLLR